MLCVLRAYLYSCRQTDRLLAVSLMHTWSQPPHGILYIPASLGLLHSINIHVKSQMVLVVTVMMAMLDSERWKTLATVVPIGNMYILYCFPIS